eukprot:gnl/TRDRNA2_/TRDRNA2_143507_c0_seq1.p1 gnl/TRDRNA2_/TRDRNA2_143507_c0~~gnl/TRDRNA2_/TRDRNA2_143507_c0_seq1.p1  ORF type:complete len:490 (-),score=97.73 gnl/TRDRNA2_/TRDRNA2_143507_c0_seq1:27-1397(-)
MDFIDDLGKKSKDRTCVLALLELVPNKERASNNEDEDNSEAEPEQILAVSTHLARNPEDMAMTKVRARQVAQLMRKITQTAVEAPVVLMGDLNADNFGEVRGIARTSFQITGDPIHSFIWRAKDVTSGPTSVTDTRKVTIDCIMYQPSHLTVLGFDEVPELPPGQVIPNRDHPSDHFPIRAVLAFKSLRTLQKDCAVDWAKCVVGTYRYHPLSDYELEKAFDFFDDNKDGSLSSEEMVAKFKYLHEMHAKSRTLLKNFLQGQDEFTLHSFKNAYKSQFQEKRLKNGDDLDQAFEYFLSDARRNSVDMDRISESSRTISIARLLHQLQDVSPVEFHQEDLDRMGRRLAKIAAGNVSDAVASGQADTAREDRLQTRVTAQHFCEAMSYASFADDEEAEDGDLPMGRRSSSSTIVPRRKTMKANPRASVVEMGDRISKMKYDSNDATVRRKGVVATVST